MRLWKVVRVFTALAFLFTASTNYLDLLLLPLSPLPKKNEIYNFKKCPARDFLPLRFYINSEKPHQITNITDLINSKNNQVCTTHFCNYFPEDGIFVSRSRKPSPCAARNLVLASSPIVLCVSFLVFLFLSPIHHSRWVQHQMRDAYAVLRGCLTSTPCLSIRWKALAPRYPRKATAPPYAAASSSSAAIQLLPPYGVTAEIAELKIALPEEDAIAEGRMKEVWLVFQTFVLSGGNFEKKRSLVWSLRSPETNISTGQVFLTSTSYLCCGSTTSMLTRHRPNGPVALDLA